MIAVTAATGRLGHHVIEGLLKKLPPGQLVAAVRDPKKAADLAARGVAVRHADYDDSASLEAAFRGVERLLLISASEVGKRLPQHTRAIEAAKKAGVKLVVYTSLLGAETARMQLANEHRETERLLRASGLPFVILRNGWYLENYTETLAPALQHGAILGSAGEGRIAAASRRDYADAAVAVLTSAGHEGKVYELAGDEGFTLAQLAAEVSRQSGKPVKYADVPEAEYAKALAGFGVPEPMARVLADSDVGITRGELQGGSDDLRRLIGRPTTKLSDAVAAALKR